MMKKMLIAATLASLSCSALATDLTIDNHTPDMYSTALVNGVCMGGAQIFTPAGTMGAKINWMTVQTLCGFTSPCKADVYVFPKADCSNLSTGIMVGKVAMDLNTGVITPASVSNGGYTMTALSNYYISFTKG